MVVMAAFRYCRPVSAGQRFYFAFGSEALPAAGYGALKRKANDPVPCGCFESKLKVMDATI